jgi:hypothetical protein
MVVGPVDVMDSLRVSLRGSVRGAVAVQVMDEAAGELSNAGQGGVRQLAQPVGQRVVRLAVTVADAVQDAFAAGEAFHFCEELLLLRHHPSW